MDRMEFVPLDPGTLDEFKREIQRAFQCGYEKEFGPSEELVLPEEDIERSLHGGGAAAYIARRDGAGTAAI